MVRHSKKEQQKLKEELEIADDENSSFDVSKLEEHRLPPNPVGLRPFSEDELKWKFSGDESNFKVRIHHKLYLLWILWATLRTNEGIETLVSKEADKESDEYKAKSVIIDIIDHLGKVLGQTPIVEECAFLMLSEQEFKDLREKNKPIIKDAEENKEQE